MHLKHPLSLQLCQNDVCYAGPWIWSCNHYCGHRLKFQGDVFLPICWLEGGWSMQSPPPCWHQARGIFFKLSPMFNNFSIKIINFACFVYIWCFHGDTKYHHKITELWLFFEMLHNFGSVGCSHLPCGLSVKYIHAEGPYRVTPFWLRHTRCSAR